MTLGNMREQGVHTPIVSRFLGTSVLLLLFALTSPVDATTSMSCPEFRVAIGRAIDNDGNRIATPKLDKRTGGFGPTTRYEMTEIVGLEGGLICYKDQLFNFNATALISSDPTETASRILQLEDLAAAAVCAVSSPQQTPQACTSLVKDTARLARDEYVKARIRGDANRYGSAGARLDDGSRIEVEANGDSVAFFLYLF
jgi:hypothetical protein